jgi:Family of unknown function (DUF5996)
VAAALEAWPELPLDAWRDTYATLHLWLQIVGKIRHSRDPGLNHCWGDTLYVTARGLTTSPIAFGTRIFQIDFDFLDHRLLLRTDDARIGIVPLQPQPVARFYARLFEELQSLGLDIRIHGRPNEVADPIPFDRDETHAS